jgi:hypothetical protein
MLDAEINILHFKSSNFSQGMMHAIEARVDVTDGTEAVIKVSNNNNYFSHIDTESHRILQVLHCLWNSRNLLIQMECIEALHKMEWPCLVKAQVGQVWASLMDPIKIVEEEDNNDKMENKCPERLSNLYPNAKVVETTSKQVVTDMILEADKGIIKAPNEVAFHLMKFGPGFWQSIIKSSQNREFTFLSTVAMIMAATTKAYQPQVLMEGQVHLRKALESALLPLVRRENRLVGKGKTAVMWK